ncbi:MAG: aldehyde dehydrogenase family protein [Candidatus Micrarchaeia archaeon]
MEEYAHENIINKLGPDFLGIYRNNGEDLEFYNFICGSWKPSKTEATMEIVSALSGKKIAYVQRSEEEDVKEAVDCAYSARSMIYSIPAIKRVEMLKEAAKRLEANKEDFINMLIINAAKTAELAEGELNSTINRILLSLEDFSKAVGEYIPGDWSLDKTKKNAIISREPLGVVACISSFNYPLLSMASKIVPALIAGNSVVAKPASDDPIVAIMFTRMLEFAGFPPGSVNLITGPGKTIGDAIAKSDKIRMITMTGSTETGKHITSVCGIKRLHLELGGKAAAIVAPDADINLAAEKILEGSLRYSGQRCDAISRVLAAKEIHKELVDKLLKGIDSYIYGDPFNKRTKILPLINEKAAEKVESLVKDAVEAGAILLKGGHRNKNFFEATLIDNVPLTARIAWEETFGPVVSIIEVENVEKAVEISNMSEYGLDACVFSKSFDTAMKIAKSLEDGSVTINDMPSHGVGYFPFGGNKNSGLGREGIAYSIEEMTRLKTLQF